MFTRRWKNWIPWIGFVLALLLRLWHLGTPPQLVSDEVFFVNDGWSYVTHQPYFDTHPPLGKLELGVAMKFFGYHPWSWRILGAVGGALIIPLVWWITRRLTNPRAANIAALLALLDGLFLVDSRLGLINISYVLPSLVAVACVLKSFDTKRTGMWLFAAGTCLGAAIVTKWLGVLVGIPMIIIWLWPKVFGQPEPKRSTQTWLIGFLSLLLWPLIVYWLVFVWHFAWQGIPSAFFDLNLHMLNYQLSVPHVGDPYSQPWWGWLLAWRPFPYWSNLQAGKVNIIQSLPNPWVWWTGSIMFLASLIRGWRDPVIRLLNMFLLFAWIPFAFIQRVMYSYHTMLFDAWLIILVSVVMGRAWDHHRRLVLTYLVLATTVFLWFAPWYLNIPLSPQQLHLRQWLPTWSVKL